MRKWSSEGIDPGYPDGASGQIRSAQTGNRKSAVNKCGGVSIELNEIIYIYILHQTRVSFFRVGIDPNQEILKLIPLQTLPYFTFIYITYRMYENKHNGFLHRFCIENGFFSSEHMIYS